MTSRPHLPCRHALEGLERTSVWPMVARLRKPLAFLYSIWNVEQA